MNIKFTKMQGAGNDFVVVDDRAAKLDVTGELARRILDRRFGAGADQLLIIRNHGEADFEMRIHNADGSEVEMCGNGVRCAAIFAKSRGIVKNDEMLVKTLAGIVRPTIMGNMVRVDMGVPEFDGQKIPVDLQGEVLDHPLDVEGNKFSISCVSMGNPHCVIYVNNVDSAPLEAVGPKIEHHRFFPKRVNVEFVEVLSRKEIKMRVWERGSGETLACGTGASAAAVISARKGLTDREMTVHLRGGDLLINWLESGIVNMTGPAVEVYRGEINID